MRERAKEKEIQDVYGDELYSVKDSEEAVKNNEVIAYMGKEDELQKRIAKWEE